MTTAEWPYHQRPGDNAAGDVGQQQASGPVRDWAEIKRCIEELRALGLPGNVIIELEDWVREEGGYNA